MKRNRLPLRDNISVLLIALGILPALFPMVKIVVPEIVLSNGAFGVWLFLVAFMDKNKPRGFWSLKFIWPIFFPWILYIISFSTGNVVFGNRIVSMTVLYFGYIVYEYYRQTGKLLVIKRAFFLVAPFLIYTTIRTAIALTANPWIARSIKSAAISASTLGQGISGYSLIYFLVALVPILVFVLMREKKTGRRILIIAAIIFSCYIIVISNYFTALIAVITATFAMFIVYHIEYKNIVAIVLLVFAMLFMVMFWIALKDQVLDFLISLSPNGRTAHRLENMRDSMTVGMNEEFSSDRMPIMLESIQGALTHPFLGVVALNPQDEDPWKYVGNHSYILDNFAIWGLIFGYLNTAILFKPFKGRMKGSSISLSVAVLLSIIIIMGFDNATNSVMLVTCMIYPLVCDHYIDRSINAV